MIIGAVKLALHDALELSKIEEEPLIEPGVIQEDGSRDCDFKDIGVAMVPGTFSFVSFEAVGGVEGESSSEREHVIWFSLDGRSSSWEPSRGGQFS